MIKLKSGIKVYDFISYRKHFNLLEMLPLAKQISKDEELFINDEELRETQLFLSHVIESKLSYLPVSIDNNKVSLKIGDDRYEVIHTQPEAFGSKDSLEVENAIALLLSELGGVACIFTISTDAEGLSGKSDKKVGSGSSFGDRLSSPVIIEKNRIIRLPACTPSRDEGDRIELIAFHNNTAQGYTRVILEANDSEGLEYKLDSQSSMFLLRLGGTFVNKLPQMSLSRSYVNYLSYSGETVRVLSNRLDGKKDNQYPGSSVSHQFRASELTQVCADERGGFIALVNGNIVTYSDEVQPDVVEDMILDIPPDERIVMIQLASRQIFALTDKMKVYSNYPIELEDNGNIIWLDKTNDSVVMPVSKGSLKQPKNVDKQTIGSITKTYNNGKIS